LIFDDQLAELRKASEKNGTTGAGKIDYALLLDGLKAEREQGITIDVAYRYFTTPRRKFIIADCPGHEQYTRNMATGASTADAAIILIDARHGVLTQTKRHAFIVSLLKIKHLIVAVNKMDLLDYSEEKFREIETEFRDFTAQLNIPDIRFIPISAIEGENVTQQTGKTPWYHGEQLLSQLETLDASDTNNFSDFRFPIQVVIRPNLDFRGFAGSIVSGVIHKGDEIVALPSFKTSKVKRIVTPDGDLEEAFAPQAVVLELEDEIDISSGDMIVRKGSLPHVADRVEARVIWMSETPLKAGNKYVVRHAGKNTQGRIAELQYDIDVNTLESRHVDELPLNHVGRIVLETSSPLFYDYYRDNRAGGAFILIDPLTNITAGAGMIRPESKQTGSDGNSSQGEIQAEFVTEAERTLAFGHPGRQIYVAGEGEELAQRFAKLLERSLFHLKAHTYGLDFHSEGVWGLSARELVQEARFLAAAGLICVVALPGLPVLGDETRGSFCIWIGDPDTAPETADRIIPSDQANEEAATLLAKSLYLEFDH
jgi:bifunctional enzyme CysN/CysC